MRTRSLTTIVTILFAVSCKNGDNTSDSSANTESTVPIINYTLVHSYPHDTTSFTEGLLVHNGQIFESTGSPDYLPQTRSLFGAVNLTTGKLDKKVELDRKYFGEGVVFLDGKVYQLTYQTKVGFIYDDVTFKRLGEFTFPSQEGWGMTTDGRFLIMSDGTDKLTYLDPLSGFKTVKILSVTNNNSPASNLNELEMINGFIYANVYTTSNILKIDSSSGKVTGRLDLASLANDSKVKHPGSLEMNGIAYDSTTKKVYITGKMWPNIYEINFDH